ncbi:MAG: DUF3052 family protein [Phycisphaerales bacterium]
MPEPAGYSGTQTAKKLGMKPGHTVALLGWDDPPEDLLGDAVEDLEVRTDLRAKAYDVIVLFAPDTATLTKRFDACRKLLTTNGGLWIAWPKKASGVATDLSDSAVREFGLATGMVDNKKCAVTDVWSGLRFVVRVKDR